MQITFSKITPASGDVYYNMDQIRYVQTDAANMSAFIYYLETPDPVLLTGPVAVEFIADTDNYIDLGMIPYIRVASPEGTAYLNMDYIRRIATNSDRTAVFLFTTSNLSPLAYSGDQAVQILAVLDNPDN